MSKEDVLDILEEIIAELNSWSRACGDEPNKEYNEALRYALETIRGKEK